MHALTDVAQEIRAYRELLNYLIRSGKYADLTEADNDAKERVRFCEEMDLYSENPLLMNASVHQRKLQALIHANDLQHIIAENAGYLPEPRNNESVKSSSSAAADENIAAAARAEPELSSEIEHDEAVNPLARSGHDYSTIESNVDTATTTTKNPVSQIIRYVSKAFIIVLMLLACFAYFFSSENLLVIIKYSFLLSVMLVVVLVGISGVSGKFMVRLRYAVGYLSFLTSAMLSGLLFLQPPWEESVFNLRGEAFGIIINFFIHRVVAIGPFWLGALFAVCAIALLITTWLSGRKKDKVYLKPGDGTHY